MSEIRVDRIKNQAGSGAVELSNGATVPSGKTLTVSGTLTYEDVTNVDSLGIVSARGGLKVGTSGAGGPGGGGRGGSPDGATAIGIDYTGSGGGGGGSSPSTFGSDGANGIVVVYYPT